MPFYDRVCSNGHQMIDCMESITSPQVSCKECGASTERAWVTKASGVIADDVPGGIHVGNGLCHEDGSPRRFDCKSEMHRFAKQQGWTNLVEHKGGRGSDKSKHTTRWISSPQNEDQRKQHWYASLAAELGITQEQVEAIYKDRKRGSVAVASSDSPTKMAIRDAIGAA